MRCYYGFSAESGLRADDLDNPTRFYALRLQRLRLAMAYFPHGPARLKRRNMDTVLIIILLLLLFGGGGGVYWGMGAGWGIGPIGLIVLVLLVAFFLNGRRGRRL